MGQSAYSAPALTVSSRQGFPNLARKTSLGRRQGHPGAVGRDCPLVAEPVTRSPLLLRAITATERKSSRAHPDWRRDRWFVSPAARRAVTETAASIRPLARSVQILRCGFGERRDRRHPRFAICIRRRASIATGARVAAYVRFPGGFTAADGTARHQQEQCRLVRWRDCSQRETAI